MKTKPKNALSFLMLALCLYVTCGCRAHRDALPPASASVSQPAAVTADSYTDMLKRNGIPEYSDFLKTLNPIRVYEDISNTVVVQGVTNGVEYGKYLVPLVSSHLPLLGEGGFRLRQVEESVVGMGPGTRIAFVYDYQRSQLGGAADGSQFSTSETNQTSGAAGSRR